MKKHVNRIRKYLSGRMSAEEVQDLKVDLSSSKILLEELDAQQLERSVIKKEKDQEAYFISIIDEVKQKVDQETK